MSGLLPSDADVEAGDGEPRVIGVDSDDADRLLAALSSTTARTLLAALHEDPATSSELADAADTSLQNVQYHLDKLEDADLVEVRGTRYSEKGREMNVYGPVDRPLVVYAGTEDQTRGVKSALTSLLGAVGVLGLASLVVQQLFGRGVAPPGFSGDAAPTTGGGDAGGGDAGGAAVAEATETTVEATRTAVDATATVTQEGTRTVAQTATTSRPPAAGGGVNFTGSEAATDAAVNAGQAAGLPPGLLFFAGGLLVVALGLAWWQFRR